jgi:hypothetical protein
MSTRVPAVCLSLLAALALAGCGGRGQGHAAAPRAPYAGRDAKQVRAAFPGDLRDVIEQADRVILYTLDPHRIVDGKLSPEAERLRTYGITGQAEITDPGERRKLIEALYRGLLGRDAGPAACFWPRHALRFERGQRAVDCLICFECTWIHVYRKADSPKEDRLLFGPGVRPVFDSVMKAHGLVAMK